MVLSLSGGLDSTVLSFVLWKLSDIFPLKVSVFHVNFHLRGKESDRDEKFVRDLARRRSWSIRVFHTKSLKKTGIQEWARKERIRFSESYSKDEEWLEAHHQDDQLETFFLRLFRGAGSLGLSGMKELSLRNGRKIWRPLLHVSKQDLKAYARRHRLKFCEDSSNRSELYDRNWIRLKFLPLIEKRFDRARRSMLRTIEQFQKEERDWSEQFCSLKKELGGEGGVWSWVKWKALSPSLLDRFLRRFLEEKVELQLSQVQVEELRNGIMGSQNFSRNLPKGWIFRGRRASRTIPQDSLYLEKAGSDGVSQQSFRLERDIEMSFGG
jgi:tRNA(Ile)-lysidine synthase